MPGLLEGQLAKAIYSGFRGKLLKATLWRNVIPDSAALDSKGYALDFDPTTWPAQGFFENYDDSYRVRAEIPSTDLRINIFAASLPSGIRPLKDDKIQIPAVSGPWYQVRDAKTDPATALWVCQSYLGQPPPS